MSECLRTLIKSRFKNSKPTQLGSLVASLLWKLSWQEKKRGRGRRGKEREEKMGNGKGEGKRMRKNMKSRGWERKNTRNTKKAGTDIQRHGLTSSQVFSYCLLRTQWTQRNPQKKKGKVTMGLEKYSFLIRGLNRDKLLETRTTKSWCFQPHGQLDGLLPRNRILGEFLGLVVKGSSKQTASVPQSFNSSAFFSEAGLDRCW